MHISITCIVSPERVTPFRELRRVPIPVKATCGCSTASPHRPQALLGFELGRALKLDAMFV